MSPEPSPVWSQTPEQAAKELGVGLDGLSGREAAERLARFGSNTVGASRQLSDLALLARQFANPIVLLLVGAAILSSFLSDVTDAVIIIVIVAASGLLSFWQERGARGAVAELLAVVRITASVMRDGKTVDVASDDVVPGDIAVLSAGNAVPGDCLLLESRDLFVDEAALTGETYPAEKEPGVLARDTALAKRANVLYMGTHVVSGTAKALVVRTGAATEFGAVAARLASQEPETEFESGVRRFGVLLLEVTLLLVLGIFAINVALHRPVLESFLFALALAVGLTPQLLPAIISVNLAHGAREMAKRKVIVKRLAAIENFGSMDVLCSDKTGTLTEGRVRLSAALAPDGSDSRRTLEYARANSCLETGFGNPIDDALRESTPPADMKDWLKLDEQPYDFIRKRLSILAEHGGERVIVTKGSFEAVLSVCTNAVAHDGTVVPVAEAMEAARRVRAHAAEKGERVLAVAVRTGVAMDRMELADESDMTLAGLLVFFDPPKKDAAATVARLRDTGVTLKLVTGDSAGVAATLGRHMGIDKPHLLTGSQVTAMDRRALIAKVRDVDIFAEIEPNQKERIVRAYHDAGAVVGYMGDGINDASALHAADVSVSVASAVDVAKDAADIVLLEQDLGVLLDGVCDGRTTFANTLKYVFMATSANFGNMFSMAGASLFLPFLPLLPTQVLLTNLMTDLPEMMIAADRVDPELLERPRRWDIGFIRRFMLVFGLLSSVFDFATFGVLVLLLHVGSTTAGQELFRTAWFTESVMSASMVVLVIRTRRPFWRSRPGPGLLVMTGVVWVAVLAMPYTPVGALFQFVAMPPLLYAAIAVILIIYASSAEVAKRAFYERERVRALEGRVPSRYFPHVGHMAPGTARHPRTRHAR